MMTAQRCHFPTLESCCQALAAHIVAIARRAVADQGRFTLVVSGGSTPKPLYRLLATPPFVEQMPWRHTHLFWGDERCVPPNHPDSNFRMAEEAMLSQPLPASPTIHRIPGEMPPSAGASAYEKVLRDFFANDDAAPPPLPVFDLILLGLGDDGHTASLFPNATALQERSRWVTATPPGILPPQVDRLTLTLPVINQASEVVFLAAGSKKIALADRILGNRYGGLECPAGLVAPKGKLLWYLADA